MDCIFCKIIKREIPAAKIYENDKIFAFLDISPINKGHTLVTTKEHFESLLNTPPEILKEIIVTTQKIIPAILKGIEAQAFNLGLNDGKIAGQMIPHIHLHIMPRFKNDGLKNWPAKKYKEGEIEKIAEKINKNL